MPATYEDRINGLTTSVAVKAPCRAATTGPVTLSGLQTVDGVALAADDRVLVMAQADDVENGIYYASTTAWQCAPDFDGARDAVKGTLVKVNEGTLWAGSFWTVTTDDPVVFGTSSITFTQSNSALAGVSSFVEDNILPAASAAALRAVLATPGLGDVNSFTKIQKWAQGAVVTPNAGSVTLGDDGNSFPIAAGNFAAIATKGVGTVVKLHFNGVSVLTHSASLSIPGAANYTTAAGDEFEFEEYAAGQWRCTGYALASGKPMTVKIIQIASTQVTAAATTTTVMFLDDTIPLNTEGAEFLSQAITPTSATNKLLIQVDIELGSTSASAWVIAALFQDATANALAAGAVRLTAANAAARVTFSWVMDAGTTSATTFKVRGGETVGTGNTAILNGSNVTRILGGVCVSSLRITEYTP